MSTLESKSETQRTREKGQPKLAKCFISGMRYRLCNEENTDKEGMGKLERMTIVSFF